MRNSTNMALLVIALAAILILFGVNIITHIKSSASKAGATTGTLALDKAEVKGMSIEKNGKIFTLNQKQQNEALAFINQMRPVDKKDYSQRDDDFDFTKLTIYRFNKSDVSLIPVALDKKNLVFNVPILSSNSYMLDTSDGAFYTLIGKASQE